jgi:hypothetical protein
MEHRNGGYVTMDIKTFGRWQILLSATCLALTAQPAQAAPQWCTGTLERMFHDGGGTVYVLPTFRNEWVAICNVNVAWQGVTTDVCKAWVSEVLSAILANKTVTLYYADVPSCATIPYYSNAPAPGYVMVYK